MAINKVIGSIPYSVGLRPVNPGDAESEKKAYAYVQTREVVTNKLLAQHLKEHGSPFSVGTLHGVIDDVYRIKFNKLSNFITSIKSYLYEYFSIIDLDKINITKDYLYTKNKKIENITSDKYIYVKEITIINNNLYNK